MQAVGIIGTALFVTIVAMGGAYVGTFSDSLFGAGEAPTPLISLTRTIDLQPVSVPIYESGARVGFCVVTARVELPNNFADEEFQLAIAQVADTLIRDLSTINAGADAETQCVAYLDTAIGTGRAVEANYYRTIRAVPGSQ